MFMLATVISIAGNALVFAKVGIWKTTVRKQVNLSYDDIDKELNKLS